MKNRYGKPPRKGTKARAFLLRALRPHGCTTPESGYLPHVLGSTIAQLRDTRGYDIRAFPIPCNHNYRAGETGPRVAYRLVGKWRWNGTYRSFLKNIV